MDYAAESFDGPVLFGERNPNPTHFQHIADYFEVKRLKRINDMCSQYSRRAADRGLVRSSELFGNYLQIVK